MKKFLVISMLFVFLFSMNFAKAATEIDYLNFGAPTGSYYNSDFDILVLDIGLPDNAGHSDMLEAITVRNMGTAQAQYNIEKVAIWADDGPIGFQGMGVDELLGYALIDGYNIWYLAGIDEIIPVGGFRIFVSAETTYSFASTTTLKFAVPQLSDINSNGSFDLGDNGIFVSSDNDGPTDISIINPSTQNLYKISYDNLRPKAVIDNLNDGDTIFSDSYTITGQARDRGGSFPAWVKVFIDDVEFSAENTNSYYSTWEFDWENLSPGEYQIKIQTQDFIGNIYTSSPITVFVDNDDSHPFENSIIEVSPSSAGMNQTVNVTVYLRDENADPVSGKEVELFLSKTAYDSVEAVNSISDSLGIASFTVTSGLIGTTLLYAKVDNVLLEWNISGLTIPVSTLLKIESSRVLDGRLVKSNDYSTVYCLDLGGVRHVFPNQNVYMSWFDDFDSIETISSTELASYPLGDNVNYKPGSLIKMPSVPKVYMVDEDYKLRWVETEYVAQILFGSKWAGLIDDMSEAFFVDYSNGADLAEENFAISVFEDLFQ